MCEPSGAGCGRRRGKAAPPQPLPPQSPPAASASDNKHNMIREGTSFLAAERYKASVRFYTVKNIAFSLTLGDSSDPGTGLVSCF